MALRASPRKVIPLATGDDELDQNSSTSYTKRVFFAGVVVENPDNGKVLPQSVQDLVSSLGHTVAGNTMLSESQQATAGPVDSNPDRSRRKRATTDTTALADVINELVMTERSYVQRIKTLKYEYADPLRRFSRDRDTAILPSYEAKSLFGNIDTLLPVNEAFLADLETMMKPDGARKVGGIGDVAIHHFRERRGFEAYKQYYVKFEEAQAIFRREMSKKSSGFAQFIERIKYANADARNCLGLRELLMEPVQRVPRYTLLFRNMIKHMASNDPQRKKLIEADEIASKIALAEADEQTKRAATMYSLSATIEGFPPAMVSNSRKFIDCIDVEDNGGMDIGGSFSSDSTGSNSNSTSTGPLHITLFLFDDKLMIVKRPNEKSGRTLAGLDELERLAKSGGLPSTKIRKSGMTFKGVVDLTEVVFTDVGETDMHMYLESPPPNQTERWANRAFRPLSVVHPPAPVNLDPMRTQFDKQWFLENVWAAQATIRSKAGQSVVLVGDECEVESGRGRVTTARTYFNVYQRKAFLQEIKKTKVVVHIDSVGSADPIPFGGNHPPYVVIRVQPLPGDVSRYNVTSSDPRDEDEVDVINTGRVPARIVQTIHQFGLFKFRTGNISLPGTPTASARSRAHLFGLDAISRNLFGTSKPDIFGGSISLGHGHKRTKSMTSRTSTITAQTTGTDSTVKLPGRSRSTHRTDAAIVTQESSVSASADGDKTFFESTRSRSRSITRNILRRNKSKSPNQAGSEIYRSSSRASASASNADLADDDDDMGAYAAPNTLQEPAAFADNSAADISDGNISLQLELARRNSQNQHERTSKPFVIETPGEHTIYEDDAINHTEDIQNHPYIPTRSPSPILAKAIHTRSNSQHSSQHSLDRRPMGPRSPSPRPPDRPYTPILPSMDADLHWDRPQSPPYRSTAPSPSPAKRQPFTSVANTEMIGDSVEPLSIKKKVSVKGPVTGSPTPVRKSISRRSPGRVISPSTTPSRISHRKPVPPVPMSIDLSSMDDVDRVLHFTELTRQDIDSSCRIIKRMRVELDGLRRSGTTLLETDQGRIHLPGQRTPKRCQPPTREAAYRMAEMRQLIGKRYVEDGTPQASSVPPTEVVQSLPDATADMEQQLTRVESHQAQLRIHLNKVVSYSKEQSAENVKLANQLNSNKRQLELINNLNADAAAEKDIMYEAFNEELDGLYNDAILPHTEAWQALTSDLRQTKAARNNLANENSKLKRRLAEAELQRDQWATLLREHGLIPAID